MREGGVLDDYRLHKITAERTKKRFGSHEVLYSKYDPQIPASAEREYIRLANQYMGILKDELEKQLPKLKEVYKRERDAKSKAEQEK